MKAKIYNLKGEAVGDIELKDEIFARPWNADLVHQAALTQSANRRQPLAHTKNRAEVSGGGIKPWKQKHTGRARHGSIRSPIWRHGGVTHGPRKDRNFEQKINKKMLRAALFSVLSKRLALGELKIVDSLETGSLKTKELVGKLNIFLNKKLNALLVPTAANKNIYKASRNIPKVKALNPAALNVEDVLKFKQIVVDKEAVTAIK